MGLLDRLSDATRTGLTNLRNLTFGRSNKPLPELTDRELEEELLRRRRDRATRRSKGAGRASGGDASSPMKKQLAQCYANLELEPGASLGDVKTAYRDLMRRFHPDRHLGDPERHKAATELAQSLTHAYQVLTDHLEGKNEQGKPK